MPGRNSQISRIYRILDLLEATPQGLTATEITERVGERGHKASRRTIYRDLEALNAAGFPLFPADGDEAKEGSRWKLERTTKINQYLVLSSRELLALYLARESLAPLRDTPFYVDIESVFRKLEEKLGKRGQEYFEQLAKEIHFEPSPKWGLGIDADLLETVRACCAEGQVLHVVYASVNGNSKRERKLGPHYLYFSKGSIYLVAEDLEEQKLKVFSVPRMSDARMSDEAYAGEPVDPEHFFANSLGVFRGEAPVEVQIEFAPQVAAFVRERRWHPTQRVVAKDGGAILVTLEVALTPELVQWVLGFGPLAIVRSPRELQKELVAAAQGILKNYPTDKKAA